MTAAVNEQRGRVLAIARRRRALLEMVADELAEAGLDVPASRLHSAIREAVAVFDDAARPPAFGRTCELSGGIDR